MDFVSNEKRWTLAYTDEQAECNSISYYLRDSTIAKTTLTEALLESKRQLLIMQRLIWQKKTILEEIQNTKKA